MDSPPVSNNVLLTGVIIGTLAGGWKAHVGRGSFHFGLKGLQLKLVLMFDVHLIVFFKHRSFKCYPQLFNGAWPRNPWRPLQNLSSRLFSMFSFIFTDGVCLLPEYEGMKCWNFIPLCLMEIVSASTLNICIDTDFDKRCPNICWLLYMINIVFPQLAHTEQESFQQAL